MISAKVQGITASMEDGLMFVNGIRIDLNSGSNMDFRTGSELLRCGTEIDVRPQEGDSALDVLLDCFWALIEDKDDGPT